MDDIKYCDHIIRLSRDHRFVVTGDDVNGTFESYKAATDEIDQFVLVKAKLARSKLSEPVIWMNGVFAKITGVHAGNGDLLLTPNGKAPRTTDLFPDTELIRATITYRRALQSEIARLDAALATVKIHRWGSYGRITTAEYARAVKSIKVNYDERMAAARELESSDFAKTIFNESVASFVAARTKEVPDDAA